MSSSLLVFMFIALLPTMLVVGCLFLLNSGAKTSKKYAAFTLKMKKQGKYEEWAREHKLLVLLEKLFPWLRLSVIPLALIGLLMEFASIPNFVLTVLKIIGYAYWPVVFILLLMMYKLQKRVPELQSSPKRLANIKHIN